MENCTDKSKKTLLIIDWGDAWGMSGWKSSDDLQKEHASLNVTSVGFEFKRDKAGITIVKGFSEQNVPLDPSFIPTGCIRKIKRIKY